MKYNKKTLYYIYNYIIGIYKINLNFVYLFIAFHLIYFCIHYIKIV